MRGYALFRDEDGVTQRLERDYATRRGLVSRLEDGVPEGGEFIGIVLTDTTHSFGVIEGGRISAPDSTEAAAPRRGRLRMAAGR
ncbi:hypothetical protein AS850_14780 [Frondihabitans sp. 762G35]|uniref:hypothetical protein n=1 Tax=Frondihabitans sp. 762G35 TaxID=1446794 RepID=UPI000D214390|nr:hypothetical protein [Frondihabitans sp. 762G35]ARC58348.1 hypothetical protein AS850_14780 [Frondihabitans sp. 762G35]